MAVDATTLTYVYAFKIARGRDLVDEVYVHAYFDLTTEYMISCSQDQSDFLTIFFQTWDLSGGAT